MSYDDNNDNNEEKRSNFGAHNRTFDSFRLATNGFIEQICSETKIRNPLLRAQHGNMEQFSDLAAKHARLCEEYMLSQAQMSDLKARLKTEKRKRKKETQLLRGRIEALKTEADETCSKIATSSQTSSCDSSIEGSLQEQLDLKSTDKKSEHSVLIAEILELKLELAKAHSQADWKDLQLNHVMAERDALREQANIQSSGKRRWSSRGSWPNFRIVKDA